MTHQDADRHSQRARAFLERDPLRHIMLLKYWQAYAASAELHTIEAGGRIGVRLLIPAIDSPYDRKTYPQADYVAFVRAEEQVLAEALIGGLRRDRAIIFKLVDALDIAALQKLMPVVRQTAFVTYGWQRPVGWQRHDDVAIERRPPAAALPFYAAQGYDADEVTLYAQRFCGRFYSCGADPMLGACFSFENYRNIHEIGGLHTLPAARRRGVARRLVETALATLADAGLQPRYQAHENNAASIALAEGLGLVRRVTAEHWLYLP